MCGPQSPRTSRFATLTSWGSISSNIPINWPTTSDRDVRSLGIGANSVIERAIIDKNARIGRNVKVINDRGTLESEEHATHVIRDGIVVIPKSTILADGTLI